MDIINNTCKKLIKQMEKGAYRFGYVDVFYAFIDYCLHACSYGRIPYTGKDEEMNALVRDMFQGMSDVIEPFEDALGDLYMEVASKGKQSRMGQFFTPEHICMMMAVMAIGEHHDTQKEPKEPCIHEPSSGSGRNILAAESVLRKQGRKGLYCAIDLDPLCAKMTAINMMLNSCKGVVFYGDTLALDLYTAYEIVVPPMCPPILIKHEDAERDALKHLFFGHLLDRQVEKQPVLEPIKPVTLFDMTDSEYVEERTKREKTNLTKKVVPPKTISVDDTQLSLF